MRLPISPSIVLNVGLLTCGAVVLEAAEAAANLPPLESFFHPPAVMAPAVSPDGTHVVYAVAGTDKSVLVLLDLASGVTVPLAKAQRVVSVTWKGNDLVVFSDFTAWAVGTVRISTHAFAQLGESKSKAGLLSCVTESLPTSASDLVVDTVWSDHAFRVDVLTGDSETLFEAGSFNRHDTTRAYVADQLGAVRARIYQGSNDTELQIREKNGAPFVSVKHWPPAKACWEPQGFSEDGTGLFVITSDDSDLGVLRSYNVVSRTLGGIVASIPIPGAQILGAVFSADGKRLLGLRYVARDFAVYWLDESRRKLAAKLESSFPGMIVELVSSSYDDQTHIIHVYSARDPGSWYVLDLRSKGLRLLARESSPVSAEQSAEMSSVDIKARDGLTLHGYLTVPRGSRGHLKCLILCPIEEPFSSRSVSKYDPTAQFWASRGYGFLRLDFRGCTGYGQAFEHAGDGEVAGRMIDDINDAAQWAIDSGNAEPGKVCLYGERLAAGLAVVAASEHPEFYCGLVDIEGTTDWEQIESSPQDSAFRERYAVSAKSVRTRSPLSAARKLRVPVFDVHEDPLNEEKSFQMACKKAHVEFSRAEFMPLKTTPFHMEARETYRARQIEPFLAKIAGAAQR